MKKRKKIFKYKLPSFRFLRNSWYTFTAHVVFVTIFALWMSHVVLSDFSDISAFAPAEKMSDYAMSDMYNAVANRRAIRQLDTNIVIVSTDGCSRNDIAELISLINAQSPAAIGLDVFFPYPSGNDSILLTSISTCANLILPIQIDTEGLSFNRSFFYDSIGTDFGFVDLEIHNVRSTVRDFCLFTIEDKDTIYNMATALAVKSSPNIKHRVLNRNVESEIIYYPSTEFMQISGVELLNNPMEYNKIFLGKSVLIGDLQNPSDSYLTPLDSSMPGVLIHAYALHTILKNKFIKVSPNWLNWLIAICICLLYTIINLIAKQQFSNLGNFLMRVVQFATMYVLFAIGCLIFTYHGNYIDFSPSILMVGLGALAFDVWFGIYACYLKIKELIICLLMK